MRNKQLSDLPLDRNHRSVSLDVSYLLMIGVKFLEVVRQRFQFLFDDLN